MSEEPRALRLDDALLFGAHAGEGLVAAELVEGKSRDEVELFIRRDGQTIREREAFEPFLVTSEPTLQGCPGEYATRRLEGGGPLNLAVVFRRWQDCRKAVAWLAKKTGITANAPEAPYLCLTDPIQQHLTATGRTLFKGMAFDELRRMQVDIECLTTEGYEFCNAEREGDAIVAIGVGDQTGWTELLSGDRLSEKEMLERLVALVRERDPDVLEGHNIFNFDLPYIAARARRHGVKLALGRDGSVPAVRPSRFAVGERTIAYERFDLHGRHVVDTMFLVHAYDISHRSLDGFGLKDCAVHFGLAAPDRTYLDAGKMAQEFARDPARVLRYLRDDVRETEGLSRLLLQSHFVQAQILPYAFQNVCVRGSATKIDALMLREYWRQGHALPMPDKPREFAGGYTDMFVRGVVQNVHHCDVRSLYPTLMLTRKLAPRSDELAVFLRLLQRLTAFRMQAKRQMREAASAAEKTHFDALQATFKVLINSFYGYLGFSQSRFSDFAVAETVTGDGRALLKSMIDWLRTHGAQPIEIDTDGIYFVPPPVAGKGGGGEAQEKFRAEFSRWLPEGIEVEFDGEYRSMYSYKMKNYAVLSDDGEMVIKGAALKSRGIEPFQREFLREMIRMKLEGRDADVAGLVAGFEKAIRERLWPIRQLAKTEILQDAPSTYSAKVARDGRARSAAYELALKSGREYRAGDQVSYYVTGQKKNVSVYDNSRLATEWKPDARDENVPYYLAKLEALYRKFGLGDDQPELALEAQEDARPAGGRRAENGDSEKE